jgi:hypothetical protein
MGEYNTRAKNKTETARPVENFIEIAEQKKILPKTKNLEFDEHGKLVRK